MLNTIKSLFNKNRVSKKLAKEFSEVRNTMIITEMDYQSTFFTLRAERFIVNGKYHYYFNTNKNEYLLLDGTYYNVKSNEVTNFLKENMEYVFPNNVAHTIDLHRSKCNGVVTETDKLDLDHFDIINEIKRYHSSGMFLDVIANIIKLCIDPDNTLNISVNVSCIGNSKFTKRKSILIKVKSNSRNESYDITIHDLYGECKVLLIERGMKRDLEFYRSVNNLTRLLERKYK